MKTTIGVLALLISMNMAFGSECTEVLQTPGANDTVTCEYEHVGYRTLVYSDQTVNATWPEGYEILEAFLAKDWTSLGAYVPGTTFYIPIDQAQARRYDFVGRLRRRSDNRTFLFVSPLWHRPCATQIPPPSAGCFGTATVNGCTITEDDFCPGGGMISVTCQGDGGSCSSTGGGGKVSCSSTETVTKVEGPLTTITTKKISKTMACPPPPPPPPPPPIP